jgi:hypothetical protein
VQQQQLTPSSGCKCLCHSQLVCMCVRTALPLLGVQVSTGCGPVRDHVSYHGTLHQAIANGLKVGATPEDGRGVARVCVLGRAGGVARAGGGRGAGGGGGAGTMSVTMGHSTRLLQNGLNVGGGGGQ